MASLTRWVEGDGNVLGARCRRTSYYCVSLVTVHVGPTWVSSKGSLLQDGEGLWPPASRSTVGCTPRHDSPWDTLTETSVKGSDAINPQGWEKGRLSETPHFFVAPPFWLVFQQSRLLQRVQGRRRSYADLLGEYAVRSFDSHDFFEGRFFGFFVEGFRSCRCAG